MKDPLVAPLAAIASGILLSRFVTFQQSELLLAIAAFLVLGLVALHRGSRVLAATEGQKSVSFRLTVGSPERTLSSEEAGEIRARIIENMRELGYELRV